ncbi:MAG: cofactor assembly of complex C subunit B [Pseudanabaenaceae cyanobacterium]
MQRVTLLAGIIGAIAILVNRFTADFISPSQTRADAIGIMLSSLAIFLGLLWQNILPKPPTAVVLNAVDGFYLREDLPESIKIELAWASHALLTNTVTQVVCIYYNDKVLLQRGKLPPSWQKGKINVGAIAQRCLQTQKPIYLANLSLYPGKIEFDYLPENTQGVIVQPIGKLGLVVVGANIPRSYTKQDEQWLQAIADKLACSLQTSP